MAYKKIGITAFMDVSGFLPNVAKFLSSIQKMNQTVTESTATMGKIQAPTAALGKAFGSLSIIAGAIVTSQVFTSIANGLKNIAERAEKAAETFQLLEVRFQTLAARDYMRQSGGTASMEQSLKATTGAAKESIEWIRRMAVTTPFTVQSLSDMSAYAQSAGFTTAQIRGMAASADGSRPAIIGLAQSIGDFSAGMGLLPEHVNRIIWNFAQMKSAGRVLGRELRDLGNSMVPVDYIVTKLAKEFKVTKDEMKSMLQSGQVNADKFIQTFNEMSATEFQGAMDRMSNTLPFAKANLQDFIDTMLGLDVLKPTADVIGGMINNMLKTLMSPEARRATVTFGFALREAFKAIADAVKNEAIPAFRSFMESMGAVQPTTASVAEFIMNIGYAIKFMISVFSRAITAIGKVLGGIKTVIVNNLSGLSKRSGNWGANIIVQFANGMATAIGAVLKVLSYIAAAITGWLKPGSPPKILPDIDEWGEAAMNEYLQGWKEADFSIFDDISGMLEKYIGAFADLDVKDSVMRILGGRAAAAEVIDAWGSIGDIPIDVVNKITDAVGISNETMTNYIRALFNLRKVSEDTAVAESILAYELGGMTTVMGNVVDSLEEAQAAALAYSGAGAESIRAYIASLTSMSIAQNNADVAQKKLNDTTKYYDDLLERLNLQQNKLNDDLENSQRLRVIDKTLKSVILTAEERERLELEKRGILLKREIRDTELARDKEVGAAQDKLDAAKTALDAAKEAADVQKKLAQDIAKATEDQVKAQVTSYEKLLETMIKNQELMNSMKEKQKGGTGAGAFGDEEDFTDLFGGATGDIEDLSAGIEEAMNALSLRLKEKWDNLLKGVTDPFIPLETDLNIFLATLDGAAQAIKDHPIAAAISGLMAAIAISLTVGSVKGIGQIIATNFGAKAIATALAPQVAKVGALIGASFAAAVSLSLAAALLLALLVLPKVIEKYGPAAATSIKQLAYIIWHGIVLKAGESLGKLIIIGLAKFKDWFSNISKGSIFDKAMDIGVDFILGLINGMVKNKIKLGEILRDIILGMLKITRKESGSESPSTKFAEISADWVAGLIMGIVDNIATFTTELLKAISTWFTSMFTAVFGSGGYVETWKNDVATWWDDTIDIVFGSNGKAPQWLTDLGTWTTNVWNYMFGADGLVADWASGVKEWWDDTVADVFGTDGKAPQWLTELGKWGASIIDSMFGEKGFVTDWLKGIGDWWSDTWDAVFGPTGWATGWINDFVELGSDIVGGIIQGLGTQVGRLWEAIKNLVREALGISHKETQSESPSKKWAAESTNWILGLVKGIEDNAYLIDEAMKTAVGSSLNQHANVTLDALGSYKAFGAAGSAGVSSVSNVHNQYISLEMSPTYKNVESPSSIYYDMTAALAAMKR